MKNLKNNFILIFILILSSCTKNFTQKEFFESVEKFDSQNILRKIEIARNYFNNHIDTNIAIEFKKSPDWERCFIAHLREEDKVVVPLNYDKNYTFSSNFSGNYKFNMTEKSYLVFNMTNKDNYNIEVVTYYPDETYANNPSEIFSGIITIKD